MTGGSTIVFMSSKSWVIFLRLTSSHLMFVLMFSTACLNADSAGPCSGVRAMKSCSRFSSNLVFSLWVTASTRFGSVNETRPYLF